MNRPITTLFMLESLDGKISTGSKDIFDVDKDFPCIDGVKEGLHQYYELEENTDLFSLNTGRVMAKIGVNERKDYRDKMEVSFVIIDNKPHLNSNGIDYLCRWVKKLILVTTNREHCAFGLDYDNLEILYYDELDLGKMLGDLYNKNGVDRLTIQSGGGMNGLFVRNDLIDYVDIVVAPILIGGSDVSTLVDGKSINGTDELGLLRPLELLECNKLHDSYIELKYKVRR